MCYTRGMTTTTRKTYETKCPYCGLAQTTTSKSAARDGLVCDKPECLAAYNESVSAWQEARQAAAKARRAERRRQPKAQPVIAGEWGMACLIGNAVREK